MAMYRSEPLENYLHPMIRILMAVPVVSWILFAVLWFPGVEFRIGFVLVVVCGPVFLVDTLDAMRGVPRELRHMMRSFRPTTVAVFPQADAAGDRAEHLHQLEGQYQPGDPRRHHRRAGRRGHRHRPSACRWRRNCSRSPTCSPGRWCWWRCCSCWRRWWRASRRACCGGAHERARRRSRCAGCARCSARPPPGRAVVAIDRLDLDHRAARGGGDRRPDRLRQVDLLRSDDRAGGADRRHARRSATRARTPTSIISAASIATVFQQDRLLPWRSALDNARLPLELIGLPEAEQRERALTWLNRLGLGQFHQCLSARIVRRHAPARGDRARLRGAARHPAGRRGLRPSRRGDRGGIARDVPGAGARMRLDRDPDHASARGSDRRRRPHRGVRQVGQALADIHVAQWPKAKYAHAARGDSVDLAEQHSPIRGCAR